MVNELRVPVPEDYMDRMRRADSADKARAEGISIAQEMAAQCAPWCKALSSALRSAAMKWQFRLLRRSAHE